MNRIISFFNKPLGLWLLTSVGLGVFGYLIEIYTTEKNLSLERLQLLSEIRYRIDQSSKISGLANYTCAEAVKKFNADQQTREADIKTRRELSIFFDDFLSQQPNAYLFKQYADSSGYSLVINYEINLKRSKFKWSIERESMNIEDIHKSLSLINRLTTKTEDNQTNQPSDTHYIIHLYGYKGMENYFQYAYAKYYLEGQFETDELDCSAKMLGNK